MLVGMHGWAGKKAPKPLQQIIFPTILITLDSVLK